MKQVLFGRCLAALDLAEDALHIHGRPTSIGIDFEQERPAAGAAAGGRAS
ncbi:MULTISPECIES: hypothetical protein [unclassified Streptomyces]